MIEWTRIEVGYPRSSTRWQASATSDAKSRLNDLKERNMGAMQNNASPDRSKSNKRGSTKNSNRLEAFSKGSPSSGADWGGCDPVLLQAVIVKITAMGGAVTFGLSRDNGAHSCTLLLDNNRQTCWFNGDADLDESLREVAATLDSMV